MIPKKVRLSKEVLINYCDANVEDFGDNESFDYISKDELLNQIKELQGISAGFSWEILKMLKDRINEL